MGDAWWLKKNTSKNHIIIGREKCAMKWKKREQRNLFGVQKSVSIIMCGVGRIGEKEWLEMETESERGSVLVTTLRTLECATNLIQ